MEAAKEIMSRYLHLQTLSLLVKLKFTQLDSDLMKAAQESAGPVLHQLALQGDFRTSFLAFVQLLSI